MCTRPWTPWRRGNWSSGSSAGRARRKNGGRSCSAETQPKSRRLSRNRPGTGAIASPRSKNGLGDWSRRSTSWPLGCPAVSDALAQLKERMPRITDLERVARVLGWDQQTMMPPAGAEHRADHLATLRRVSHELLTDAETGRLLDRLHPREETLDPDSDDAALIRLARRDYDKAA